jgi:hypothetical protein
MNQQLVENIEAGRFVIMEVLHIHTDGFLFWNNEDGYVDLDSATFFDHEELAYRNLPCDAAWVPAKRAAFLVGMI